MSFKNYKKEDLFTCYSLGLFHFLKINGFRYLHREFNPNTNKAHWVFEKTPEFKKALDVFMGNKK